MTKTEIAHELRNVRRELDWLLWCEALHNPDYRFRSSRYSKRRVRLVRTFWALKGLQQRRK